MRNRGLLFHILLYLILSNSIILASDPKINTLEFGMDSLSRKETKKLDKKAWRKELNESNRRYFIMASLVNANLDTRISFQLLDNLSNCFAWF